MTQSRRKVTDPDFDVQDVCGHFEYEYYLDDAPVELASEARTLREQLGGSAVFPDVKAQLLEAIEQLDRAADALMEEEREVAITAIESLQDHCRRTIDMSEQRRLALLARVHRDDQTPSVDCATSSSSTAGCETETSYSMTARSEGARSGGGYRVQ